MIPSSKFARTVGLPPILAFLLLVCLRTDGAGQSPSVLNIDQNGQNVRLSWPATVGEWLLESSADFSDTAGWIFSLEKPTLLGGNLLLDVPIESQQQFFRLCTLSTLFVDSSNTRDGDGSFENPFKTMTLAAARARDRFAASGKEQILYVLGGDYSDAVHFDGTGLVDYRVTLLDSTVPIGINGQIIAAEQSGLLQ